jgi:hypothetical protein
MEKAKLVGIDDDDEYLIYKEIMNYIYWIYIITNSYFKFSLNFILKLHFNI